ncbi:MAG: hypothetical protein ACRC5A_03320 [Enterobacteriaceae bacterium]
MSKVSSVSGANNSSPATSDTSPTDSATAAQKAAFQKYLQKKGSGSNSGNGGSGEGTDSSGAIDTAMGNVSMTGSDTISGNLTLAGDLSALMALEMGAMGNGANMSALAANVSIMADMSAAEMLLTQLNSPAGSAAGMTGNSSLTSAASTSSAGVINFVGGYAVLENMIPPVVSGNSQSDGSVSGASSQSTMVQTPQSSLGQQLSSQSDPSQNQMLCYRLVSGPLSGLILQANLQPNQIMLRLYPSNSAQYSTLKKVVAQLEQSLLKELPLHLQLMPSNDSGGTGGTD